MSTIFASNLRIKKKEYGLTQGQIAIKVNRKRSLVGAWLEGRSEPRLEDEAKLIEIFNIENWHSFITRIIIKSNRL